jgi:hypothetical protein
VKAHGAPEDGGVAIEDPLPKSIADHNRLRSTSLFFFRAEGPSQLRGQADYLKKIVTHVRR